jgi:hypothetical protein
MNKWKAIAIILFIFGFGTCMAALGMIYVMMTTVPQGYDPITAIATVSVILLAIPAAMLYGGYRSLKKSRVAPPPRRIIRQPTIKPEPSVTVQAETGADAVARAQATTFASALKGVVEYENIAINLPMPEETLKKYGWQSLKTSRQFTVDDEPLVDNLSKLVSLGPIAVPLLKSTIQAVAAGARSASQFRNAGLLCLVMGKIGGKEACDALRDLLLMRSNVYEYQYIRGQAALGLALAGDKGAGELLFNMRRKGPPGMEAQYGWIARNLDEALTMLGVELPETWDRVATQFVSEIDSGTPDFKEFSRRLRQFSGEEIGGAWNQVASEYWRRGEKLTAQSCWVEGLYWNPSPDFVAAWGHLELPPGAPKNLETVERLRKELGSIIE